jgi:hypothetical protein
MAINSSTCLSDTILYIRDFLKTNLVDPNIAKRTSGEGWVFTSYPKENITYPIVTVLDDGGSTIKRLGMQSTMQSYSFTVQIKIWARDMPEKDKLFNQVYEQLNSHQFITGGSREAGLHDFKIDSVVNVDEEGPQGIKSKIIRVKYMYIKE